MNGSLGTTQKQWKYKFLNCKASLCISTQVMGLNQEQNIFMIQACVSKPSDDHPVHIGLVAGVKISARGQRGPANGLGSDFLNLLDL